MKWRMLGREIRKRERERERKMLGDKKRRMLGKIKAHIVEWEVWRKRWKTAFESVKCMTEKIEGDH